MYIRNTTLSLLFLCSFIGDAVVSGADLNEISNSPRGQSLPNNYSGRRLQTEACTLLLKVTTYEDGHEEEQVDCFDEETKSYSKVQTARGADFIQSELLSKFKKGELHSAESTLMHEGAYYEGDSLVLPSESIAKAEFGQNIHSRGRRRLAISGTRTYLAVRVIGADKATTASISEISNEWFGTYGDPVNYKSQIEACSYNAVTVSKFTGSGVTEGVTTVTISNTVSGASDDTIRDAADLAVSNLGLGNPDHTILCLPPGTSGGWIGYAYIDWDLSVFNDNWCLYPSIQMHEIGHNWNLGHSGYNSDEYGDQSSMMGYSYSSDDNPVMCFNAPKNRQLGWYSDRTVTVTSGWTGRLYGLSSYSSSTSNDAVILYIPSGTNGSTRDYYVSFNGDSGINSGTQLGGNMVLIHYRNPGTDYEESTLVGGLNSGSTYTGAPLTITVSSISGSTFAQVTVGTVVNTPAPTRSPTSSPTAAPTNSPTSTTTKSPTSAPTKAPTTAPVASPVTSAPVASPVTSSPVAAPVTPAPTPSPTKAPTSPPVSSPVSSPVTSSPTMSPVASPVLDDSSCLDFPDAIKWTRRRTVYCSQMTAYRCSKNKGKSLCPNACGTTADWCGDNLKDAKGRVEYGTNANGDIIWKGCAFVKRAPAKIDARCSKGNIAIACRATCAGARGVNTKASGETLPDSTIF
ncbi:hypothetical protein CTEN210_16152 [Chaetoceros tenuissimus]|uniref:Peptidase M11 gametolysin domain-containing protein n=1 Tax=Chaetoceros tenuissimus TaxID=426638 RepID=A0AAD3DAI6_9STRA|nr:hypothetical protein CTEN210_16152 [Chaetoceros tenuissimus]